jgi:hypothetical protein
MLSDSARRIADEAKVKNCWIYSPDYKRWYSPEEFKHIFTYANAPDDFIQQLQVLDPREGIQAGFQRMTDINNKLQIFAEKVLEYYRK